MIRLEASLLVLSDAGHALRAAFFMFWDTCWALVLGLALSGAVQAFVPKAALQRRLGNHRPAALGRAAGFGVASSSCSYAAAAMAKSLFQNGADFLAAMGFMIASTNLVLELGVVIVVLLGWPFAIGEFAGGIAMLVLLAVLGPFVLGRSVIGSARARLIEEAAHEHAGTPSVPSMRSLAGWSDAASYAVADFRMLRRELIAGFLVAGMLGTLVPTSWYDALFVHGHGVWTLLENAAIAPLLAFVSCVCSIGNVPLAAALWHGNANFAGVLSFLYGDLLAAPLVLLYWRYYGRGLGTRLVALLYGAMVIAGVGVSGMFSLLDYVPTTHAAVIVPEHLRFDSTSVLNVCFLLLAVGLVVLHRAQRRVGGGAGLAIDPVCGMQVRIADAPATRVHVGRNVYFCSDHCAMRFDEAPHSFALHEPEGPHERELDGIPQRGASS